MTDLDKMEKIGLTATAIFVIWIVIQATVTSVKNSSNVADSKFSTEIHSQAEAFSKINSGPEIGITDSIKCKTKISSRIGIKYDDKCNSKIRQDITIPLINSESKVKKLVVGQKK